MYIGRDSLWGIGSPNYEGWEDPWSANCKLNPWESQFQSESEGLRFRGADGVNLSPWERESWCSSSRSQARRKKRQIAPYFPFYSIQPSMDWMMLTFIGKGDIYWSHWFKCQYQLEIPLHTPRNNVWVPLDQVKLMHKINHHRYLREKAQGYLALKQEGRWIRMGSVSRGQHARENGSQ